jgi:hypothetical protein
MSEFFVGYLPKQPPGIGRRVRVALAIVFVLAIVCALVFARVQRTFSPSAFEYGNELSFEGTIEVMPYPALVVARPTSTSETPYYSRYFLVGAGKHGADSEIASFEGKTVRLKGQLVYRDIETLIEVMPGTIVATGAAPAPHASEQDLGPATLTGEIVDSKCYFGVMNPGSGKVHRDCAVRCLSGGIPPSFVTNNYKGSAASFLLVGPDRQKLPQEAFLPVAGRPVRVTGKVLRSGDSLYFLAVPSAITLVR